MPSDASASHNQVTFQPILMGSWTWYWPGIQIEFRSFLTPQNLTLFSNYENVVKSSLLIALFALLKYANDAQLDIITLLNLKFPKTLFRIFAFVYNSVQTKWLKEKCINNNKSFHYLRMKVFWISNIFCLFF